MRETCEVTSQKYKDALRLRYREVTGQSIKREHLNQALDELQAVARLRSPEREVFRRIAYHDRKHYLDLCNRERQVVEIGAAGWRVTPAPREVPFLRSTKSLPLPVPERGGKIKMLWDYVTVAEENRPLIPSWLIGSMRADIACPGLLLFGEAGTGKTGNASFCGAAVHPVAGEKGKSFALNRAQENARDLFIAAKNSSILAMDNLSGISQAMSDALCCIVTGAADETRKLYTNNEESRFVVKRPVLLTSRGQIINESDLADRIIAIELPELEARKAESDLWAAFQQDHAKILGALLDAFVVGLREEENVTLKNPPRMMDFARFAQAAETAFGYKTGTTVAAMHRAQQTIATSAVNESELAKAIITTTKAETFEGTASALMEKLGYSTSWPQSPKKFANELAKIVTDLQKIGVKITKRLLQGRTTWTISSCKVSTT